MPTARSTLTWTSSQRAILKTDDNKYAKGKRNLRILLWTGWAAQLVGVLYGFAGLLGGGENVWRGSLAGVPVFLFGLAFAGWAGNLLEINELKKRVSELEGPMPN